MELYKIFYLALCFSSGLLVDKLYKAAIIYLLASGMMITSVAKAEKSLYFKFNYKTNLSVTVPALDYREAYLKASKECFKILTKGNFPGDEEGLNAIDICTNPVKD